MPTYEDDPTDPHFRHPQFGKRAPSCLDEPTSLAADDPEADEAETELHPHAG